MGSQWSPFIKNPDHIFLEGCQSKAELLLQGTHIGRIGSTCHDAIRCIRLALGKLLETHRAVPQLRQRLAYSRICRQFAHELPDPTDGLFRMFEHPRRYPTDVIGRDLRYWGIRLHRLSDHSRFPPVDSPSFGTNPVVQEKNH